MKEVCGGKLREGRNKEDKRWMTCGWEKTEEKRNKKRVTSGGVIVDILDIVEADLRGVSVDNLCLGISVIA